MSSKADILEKINSNTSYIGTKVKEFVNSVTCENDPQIPSVYKKGDVIRVRINATSDKTRPSIIIKVAKEYVISIPLTSVEDINALCPSTGSRFFKDCFFCNTYVVTPTHIANINFLGVYDSPKALNNAIKELRMFINKNI